MYIFIHIYIYSDRLRVYPRSEELATLRLYKLASPASMHANASAKQRVTHA